MTADQPRPERRRPTTRPLSEYGKTVMRAAREAERNGESVVRAIYPLMSDEDKVAFLRARL